MKGKKPKQTEPRMPAKKAYAAPRLVEYGSIAKLTQGAAGSMTEAWPSMMTCL
jgi:hypothetical protein